MPQALRDMAVPRGYLTFGDLDGKLDLLRLECTKCDRKGRYSVAKLIAKHGRKGNMMKWREMLSADCPRRDATGRTIAATWCAQICRRYCKQSRRDDSAKPRAILLDCEKFARRF
jgi:hypothetical protein